jgi:hypothetical protein
MPEPYTLPDDVTPAEITLVGVDGNAGAIMGAVARGLRRAGNPSDVIDRYRREAMSGNYDHLLAVSMAHCAEDGF